MFPIRTCALSIKSVYVFPRVAFWLSFGSLNHVLPTALLSHVNRAVHLALVPLHRLAKDFKDSYLTEATLALVSCDGDNSVHKLCLTCRVLLAVWKFPEAHLLHPLWQSLALCGFGEQPGVDGQGRRVRRFKVELVH